VILPAGTVISTEPDANGEAVDFELGFDIILDAADARPTTTGGTVFSISKLAAANEGRTVAPTVVGTSKGIPNAEFVLPNDGVIDRTVQVFTQEGGQVITWSEIDKLSLATPTQSVFMTYVDDEDFTHVVFGDNSSGRIPPTNVSIYVGYRYGVGEKANRLPSNSITVLRSNFAVQQGVTATNTAPPSGGADVESTESMRYSIPRANALQQRAVTLADYVSLALQVPGITKATAYGKNYSTVYVRVASTGQSTGYRTLDATHRHVASGTATLVTGSDLSMNLGQIIYVTDSGIAGLNGSQATTAVFYSNTPLEITAAVIDTNVATVTTAVSHGMKPGQPVALSGFTAGSAVFNGTFVVTATSATTFSFALTNTNLTATLNTAELATPRPGVAYTTAEANSVIATSTGTVTTLDPDMQKLIFSLESYLEDKKLIGSVVYGEPVEWADTEIDLDVVVRPLYNREAVRAAVQEAVENVFAYETVDFGKRISIGDVYRAALSVSGVDYIILTTLRPVGTAGPVVDIDDDSVGVEYDYMIPRIDPLISPTWVTATGGLANT
jgi:exosome complex RNA-binding protein Csl4